ncbi:MAG TPA: hypothetical protein VE999_05885 [Gemmataceae bacterium]|nr:hypothetical protein [Gemmataceae bacterium]
MRVKLVDGADIHIATADLFRLDVQRAYGMSGYHGFAVPLSKLRNGIDRRLAIFAVTTAGAEVRLAGPRTPRAWRRGRMREVGSIILKIDPGWRRGCISGWALDRSEPTRRVELTISNGFSRDLELRATRFRDDATGDGLHGFLAQIESGPRPLTLIDSRRGVILAKLT